MMLADISRLCWTNERTNAYAPKLRDRLAEGPIALGTHRSIDRSLHDWHAPELFAEHDSEGDKDAVV